MKSPTKVKFSVKAVIPEVTKVVLRDGLEIFT